MILIASVMLAVVVGELLALSEQYQATGSEWFPVSTDTLRYLESVQVSDHDEQLLNQPRVAQLFSRYRYDWRGSLWRYREIVSPLIHHFVLFTFFAVDGSDDYSRLSLVIGRDGDQIYLIPVQNHGMVGYPHVADDPHNMAIFNALIAGENIHPAGPSQWFSVALIYLNLVSERLQLADWDDYAGDRHAGMLTLLPRLRNLKLLPQVACRNHECEVRIADLHPKMDDWIEWELDFDTRSNPPQLTFVGREMQARGSNGE